MPIQSDFLPTNSVSSLHPLVSMEIPASGGGRGCVMKGLDWVCLGLVTLVSHTHSGACDRLVDVGDEGLVRRQLHTPPCVRQDPTTRTECVSYSFLCSVPYTQPLTVSNAALSNHSQAVCRRILLQSQTRSI